MLAGRTVIIPCFRWLATSHQFIGYAITKPTSRPIDITNQKAGVQGSVPDAIRIRNAITVGTIPAINKFIERSSGMNVLVSEREYEPPAISRINNAWKIIQPNANPRTYS